MLGCEHSSRLKDKAKYVQRVLTACLLKAGFWNCLTLQTSCCTYMPSIRSLSIMLSNCIAAGVSTPIDFTQSVSAACARQPGTPCSYQAWVVHYTKSKYLPARQQLSLNARCIILSRQAASGAENLWLPVLKHCRCAVQLGATCRVK